MNRSLLRAGVLAGASTLVLSLVATPALALLPGTPEQQGASVQPAIVAPAPTVTLTPAHITVKHFDTVGIVAHLTGFTPGETVNVAWGSADLQRGDLIGSPNVGLDGTLDVTYRPAAGNGPAATYTLSVFYGPGTPQSSTAVDFTVRSGSVIHWQPAHLSGAHLQVSAVVAKWSAKSKRYVRWADAAVKFQEKVAGSWVTKKTVHTDAHGVATADITAGRHTWRAVLVGTGHTWGGVTGTHRK